MYLYDLYDVRSKCTYFAFPIQILAHISCIVAFRVHYGGIMQAIKFAIRLTVKR